MMVTYPASSFCSLAMGLAEGPLDDDIWAETPLVPPPPRNGLAMRPKFKGEATAFWATRFSCHIWKPTFFEHVKKTCL